MHEVRKILLPTDFSASAREALDHALFLAQEFDADLHMLYAITFGDPFGDMGHPFPEREELLRRLFDIADSELGRMRRSTAEATAVRIIEEKRRGNSAAPVILDYATEIGADLVVMGSHGRRGVSRWVLGSVAEKVIRTADCPVMTVRAAKRSEVSPCDLGTIEHVLLPLDFAATTPSAIVAAKRIAHRLGASLQVLHVVDLQTLPAFYGPAMGDITARLTRESQEKLRDLVESSDGPDVPHQCFTISGRAAASIVDFSATYESGLIIIPSHGYTGTDRLLLGSTAEHVARRAPCPVLTLKGAHSRAAEAPPQRAETVVR